MSEVTGSIIHIGNTEVVGSAGTFKKRLLVVKSDEQFPQEIPIDFVQDKCDILNGYQIGQNVKVSINIRGNSYNGKWYVSLNGWRVESITNANNVEVNQPVFEPAGKLNAPEDDLPF